MNAHRQTTSGTQKKQRLFRALKSNGFFGTRAATLRGKQKKKKIKMQKIKAQKVPPGAREEPTIKTNISYSEEPVKKGKTHYEEDEEPEANDIAEEL